MKVYYETTEVTAMKTITAFIASLWLSIPAAFQIMLFVMACDLISALFNPSVRFKRRVTVVSLSALLALMVQIAYTYAVQRTKLNLGFDLAAGVCVFYSLSSAVDTVVNFNAAGVRIPPVLLSWALKAQGLTGHDREQLERISQSDTTVH